MFHRDYFMRIIGQMTEALAALSGLRQRGKQEEGLKVIGELLKRQFRLTDDLLRTLSPNDIISLMTVSGVRDDAGLQAIAALLKEQGDLHEALNEPGASYSSRLKALHLSLRLALEDADPLVADPRALASGLLDKLGDYELPTEIKRLAAAFYEQEGRYGKAEDAWYELLDDGEASTQDIRALYSRLLRREDAELEAGGLPRAEIEEARAGLEESGNDEE